MILKVKPYLRTYLDGIFGNLDVWEHHRETLRTMPSIRKAINTIQKRWNFECDDLNEYPIFIFSAGWRSGSTLLQRLVCSTNEILIWGEPYSNSDYTRKLADSLRIFKKNVPPAQFFIETIIDNNRKLETDNWIACLYPNTNDLRESHRAFFKRLYEEPAKKLGYTNWGIKEVRFDIEYAYYLRWLFPGSKFIFIYRNPYEAYRSYRSFSRWYDRWPDAPVFTSKKFGIVWTKLLKSFLEDYKNFESYIVKYENLLSKNSTIDDIESFIGTKIDKSILSKKITGRKRGKIDKIPLIERFRLSRAVEPLAGNMGYTFDR